MKFGKTVRRLRQSKSISLKACYTGIVVKSFAIRFENEEVNLNLLDFLAVLEQLAVTPEEFFYIHFGYENSLVGGTLQTGVTRIFSGKFSELEAEKLYEKYRKSPKQEEKLLAYLSHFYRCSGAKKLAKFPESEKNYLLNYFQQNESWSLVETLIYPSCGILFPEELRIILMKRCLKTIKQYQNFMNLEFQTYFAQSLANFIFVNLNFGQWQSGLYFLPTLQQHLADFPLLKGNLWLRIQVELFEAIEMTIRKDLKQVENKLQSLQEKCHVMGFPDIGAAYLTKYQEICAAL